MILTYLVWLYAALLLAYIVWIRLDIPRPWWLKAFDTVSFWFFAPSLLLLVLAVFVSRTGYRLGATVIALLFIGHFWLRFLPWGALKRRIYPPARREPDNLSLLVMTANLLRTNGDGHCVAATIASEGPDVVALQELKTEHVQAIREELIHDYPYQELHPGLVSEGLGLLSRIPFTSHELIPGKPGANPTQIARLVSGNKETWLVNTHSRIPELRHKVTLGLLLPCGMDTEGRETDIQDLVQIVTERPGNALIVGDLNTTEHCQEYQLIPRRWHDTYRELGWGAGWTFPVGVRFFGVRLPFPIFRIDYIFHRGSWQARTIRSGRMPGSDHRYLVAELE